MRDSKNSDFLGGLEVYDVIRKARYAQLSDRQVLWDSRHGNSEAREIDDPANRAIDGIEELDAKAMPATLIPTAGLPVLGVGLIFEVNSRTHRLRSSASARARTSSHGIPCDSPDSTRRARLSISAAQAASTSAGSSVPVSSRLASSSAATSARSWTGRASASRRTSCAREVIQPF